MEIRSGSRVGRQPAEIGPPRRRHWRTSPEFIDMAFLSTENKGKTLGGGEAYDPKLVKVFFLGREGVGRVHGDGDFVSESARFKT